MTIDPSKSAALPCAPNEIVITRVFHAPRELVWRAMIDPAQVVHWWGPVGFTTINEEHDFRVGGIWKLVMIGPDGARYPNKTTFTAIKEFEQVSYVISGAREGEQGINFEATWSFEIIDARTTRLTINHKFSSQADRDRVIEQYGALEGGKQTLARLDEFLAQRQS